ncbi:MAG TPA: ribosome silencing factor [Acidimicrobiales bacterium]|nr:ribosome silencing factor [Acidimicrobiales bacterium]
MTSISSTPVVERDESLVPEECLVAARAAEAKSGERTAILAMGELLGITDAFVITSGRNTRQVKTIVDEVERQVKASGGRGPTRVEGLDDSRWVLMDYGDFLVHVFLDEARDYYDLEHLWLEAPRMPWDLPARAEPSTR